MATRDSADWGIAQKYCRPAKHDETYMPKDVADAPKKSGHWKDDYAQRGARPAGGEK